MKVCIIHSIFPPYARGGAEIVAHTTARAFTEGGHEVFVITCAPYAGVQSFAGAWETMDRLRVFRFTPFNLFTIFNISKYPVLLRLIWHGIDMFNLHTYLVVKKILMREKPDLIITRNLKGLGYTIPIAIRNWKLEIRNSTKWFHGLHDLGALHPRGFMEWGKEHVVRNPNPLTRLYRAINKRLFGSPDVVVAPSQFVLDEYQRAGFFPKSKKVMISNPVAHNPPPPSLILREGAADRSPLRVRGDRGVTRFLFIGQLESYKGLRVLLAAWRQFVAQHREATLEIVGQGSLREEVKRVSQMLPGIRVRGPVPHEELSAVYAGAWATIVPSLAYETFGLVVAESFAHGVPVVAAKVGALPELVEDGVNGFLVVPGDQQGLVDALEKIIDPAQRAKLGAAAPNFAHQYSLPKYRMALEQLRELC